MRGNTGRLSSSLFADAAAAGAGVGDIVLGDKWGGVL